MEDNTEISFKGFGPIASSNPTFAGGFGRGGSFAPLARKEVTFPPRENWTKRQQAQTPFGIWTQTLSSTFYVGVNYYSDLWANFADSTSGVTVTGLLGDNPASNDPGWIAVSGTNIPIYLEIAITDGNIASATIKADSSYVGGAMVTGGDTENDGGTPAVQTYARKLLARVEADNQITQIVYSSMGMINLCINGIPSIYPILT